MSARDWQKVTRQRHGERTWHHVTNFTFAAGLRHAVLTTSEIARCALAFPVVFGADGAPVALLRVTAPRSIFVSVKGAWRAAVLPEILRLYPFHADVQSDKQGEVTLWVDEASGCVSRDKCGLSFFTPEGLTQDLADIAEAFARRHRDATKLSACYGAMEACRLLAPLTEGENGGEEPAAYRRVDAERLAALTETEMLTLHRNGALGLAQACALSMGHMDWMQRAEARISCAEPSSSKTSKVAGFLAEVGRAQAQDAELFTSASLQAAR
ncbi:SapC family protein [Octadecabacter sp. G9-8]|uniref:SapC family protein n=1 Tax=Octadecabacter dasysiphoniae TaxID=2909341 RepID=A0ABS9CYF8_9RHOB|nr:SapC family protein [Octadecabacter dasysiphoniae]MCF2872305.1 SapC family protein [Octadecabacter dasysiphoniae]